MAQQIKITQTSNADMNIGVPKNLTMAQQTAVEWLQELYNSRPAYEQFIMDEEFEQAKAMEQLEIYAAYEAGWINGDLKKAPRFGSDYYDQTYNKGAE